jgi:hypothetical protein
VFGACTSENILSQRGFYDNDPWLHSPNRADLAFILQMRMIFLMDNN